MYKIFIIEDDATMAEQIAARLFSWGQEAACARDFSNVMKEFSEFDPHLVLIDITLPFYNGYHWCSEIRRVSDVPLVFLSSAADDMNIIMAMNMGADDFIPKPVDLNVMVAKISALLRRTYDLGGRVPVLEHRGAMLNLNDTSLTYGDNRLELTKNEFRILEALMEQKGKVVSRDALMTRLWQMDSYVEENTLTVNVTRLRKKLEGIGLRDFIVTKVGSGYMIPG